ncbi:hypothetical protein SLS56_003939 [Neofusicoccum ribis]|uniref:Uncharacterized protein n=1 Tax=Neofusicoccum ribis TaxID=45134 RepID=A0ABR3SXZ7_9PEZI
MSTHDILAIREPIELLVWNQNATIFFIQALIKFFVGRRYLAQAFIVILVPYSTFSLILLTVRRRNR